MFLKGNNIIHNSGNYTATKKIDSPEGYGLFCNDVVDKRKKEGDDVSQKDLIVVSLNLLHVEEDAVVELPELNVIIPRKGV
jgi:hypothetical protein